ncbi:MAG: hypothetical protein GY862_15965 [Gammaproteobacteria bacterium]|nr:hypothetical protein [Gammaproteobacteria bacterium]
MPRLTIETTEEIKRKAKTDASQRGLSLRKWIEQLILNEGKPIKETGLKSKETAET